MIINDPYYYRLEVDWRDTNPDNRLVYAVEENKLDIARAELAAGADVHAYDDLALHNAASRGHAQMVKLLLDSGANMFEDGASGLDNAIEDGFIDVVAVYLDAGMPVDYGGNALLDWAIYCEQLASIQLLLDRGADVFAIHTRPDPPITDPFAELEMTPEVRAVIERWLLCDAVKKQKKGKGKKEERGVGL